MRNSAASPAAVRLTKAITHVARHYEAEPSALLQWLLADRTRFLACFDAVGTQQLALVGRELIAWKPELQQAMDKRSAANRAHKRAALRKRKDAASAILKVEAA